ncbi:hypothetical protein RFM71_004569 [Vibrio parahaemolyticus]|nr:hypothetical protein [Vibrio parahaemolyticus]
MKDKQDVFGKAKFDVEHALDMYANSFFTLPAEFIYEKEALEQYKDIISRCHIYMIGFLPQIDFDGAEQVERNLKLKFIVVDEPVELEFPLPDGLNLKVEDGCYLLEQDGDPDKRGWWNELEMQKMVCDHGKEIQFDIKYIGQAYGSDGKRNALDRLLKHETLQKISLKGVPKGYRLSLLLLEVQPDNRLVSVFNPFAQEKDEDGERIRAGLDKLRNTTEAERISLYEAALIRYFSPEFNKEFKNSFPSTNLKLLQDCYEKDFSAVIAQICIDELPFRLCSELVKPKVYHISKHPLHKAEDRDAFFCK